MAFCTQCGARLTEAARFCTQCGNPVRAMEEMMPPATAPAEEPAPAVEESFVEIPEEPVAEIPTEESFVEFPEEPGAEIPAEEPAADTAEAPSLVEFPGEPAMEESNRVDFAPEAEVPAEAPVHEAPAEMPAYEESDYTPPAYEQPVQEMPPVFYDAPSASRPPVYAQPEKPVSPWMYLLLMIVFAIPVVGFIVIIVLACGAAANKNIRNFALAYVLVWVICIALGILLALVAMPFIMELVNELQYMF